MAIYELLSEPEIFKKVAFYRKLDEKLKEMAAEYVTLAPIFLYECLAHINTLRTDKLLLSEVF